MKKYFLPIATICLLCVLLTAGFTLMSVKLVNTQQANVQAQQALLLENLRTPVHNALQSASLGAETLASSLLARDALMIGPAPYEAEDVEARRLSVQKMAMLFPYVELLAVVDRNNIPCLSSYPLANDTKIVDDRHIQQSLRGIREFSAPYVSPLTGSKVIAATSPIALNKTIIGVAVAVINMQKLSSATTNRFEMGNTGHIILMDNSGTFILHPDFSMLGRNVALTTLGQQLIGKESGHAYGSLFDDVPQWAVFTSLPRTNWKLLLIMPYTEYMRPVALLRTITLLAGLAMLLLVMLCAGWLALMLIRRMEKARLAADESIQAKDNFLANMSHEIRTPMNGIIGLSHLLGRTSLNTQQNDYLQKIQFSANSLLRLISDILDISKIEAHKLVIERVCFRLTDLLTHMQNSLLSQARHKGLRLDYSVQPDVPRFLCTDPYRLGQILLNLVGNGLKFTENGTVHIHVSMPPDTPQPRQETQSCRIVFAVTDTGIGISAETLQSLFRPFTQADASTTRKFGGTGLGLVICKHLAGLLGGDVVGVSQQGKGSTFTCTITCEGYNVETGLEAGLETGLLKLGDGDSFVQNTPVPQSTFSTTGTSPTDASPTGPCRVLLVEDNEINQQVAEELLRSMGAEVTLADNGIAAVELAGSRHFDIIFMDIQMPEMDGITATKILREKGMRLPIVAMTAHAMSGDYEKSIAAGMNDHITKPICPVTLQKTLHTYCPQCFPGGSYAS